MIPVCGTKILYAAGCSQKKLDSESMLNTNLRNIWLLKENNTLDRKGKTLTLNKRSINFQIPPPSSACTVGKTSRTGRTAGAPGKHSKHSPPVFPATKGRPLLRRLRPQPALAPVRHLPNRTARLSTPRAPWGPVLLGFSWQQPHKGWPPPPSRALPSPWAPSAMVVLLATSLLPQSRAMAGGAPRAVSCPQPNELQTRPFPRRFLQGMSRGPVLLTPLLTHDQPSPPTSTPET